MSRIAFRPVIPPRTSATPPSRTSCASAVRAAREGWTALEN